MTYKRTFGSKQNYSYFHFSILDDSHNKKQILSMYNVYVTTNPIVNIMIYTYGKRRLCKPLGLSRPRFR